MPQLMTKDEIHAFGLQILMQYLEGRGYKIEMAQPNKACIPHIVAQNGPVNFFILAATDVYPKKGVIADSDKALLLESAEKYGAVAACAYLGIANAAGLETNDKELLGSAYRDARFVTDFSGLEFIQFED